jgi:hypothetical protein
MRPPYHRRATFGAQLASLLYLLAIVSFLALATMAGCSRHRVDADVRRVVGPCPVGSAFLYAEWDRAHSWCRDTTRVRQ